jgi:hypothetical protein
MNPETFTRNHSIGVKSVAVVVVVRGSRGRAEREGEAVQVLEREAKEKVEDVVAAQSLWVARNVLAQIRRHVGHPRHHRAVHHHVSITLSPAGGGYASCLWCFASKRDSVFVF